VVAIGAIAYLSYNKAPAGKDAAGTIVEAKRARTDGTNSFNPTPTASTTDQSAADASQGTAGPDAAKDAAAAAGSGDNAIKQKLRADMNTKNPAAEATDAAAAAGRQTNSHLRGGAAAGHEAAGHEAAGHEAAGHEQN